MTHQDFLNLSDIHRTDLDLSLIILDSLMVDFDFESVNFNADKIIQSDSEQENLRIIYKNYVKECLRSNKGYFKNEKLKYAIKTKDLSYSEFYKYVFINRRLSTLNKCYYDKDNEFGCRLPYRNHYVTPYIEPIRIEYQLSKGYKMTIRRNHWSNFYTIRIIASKNNHIKNKWYWSITYDWLRTPTNPDVSIHSRFDKEYYHHGYFLFPCQTLDKTIKIAKYFIHHFKTLNNGKTK